jgi:uncharacterized paraquat-inducible protein A
MPWIESKFDGFCKDCGDLIDSGDRIYYNGKAYCAACGGDIEAGDKRSETKPKAKGSLTY